MKVLEIIFIAFCIISFVYSTCEPDEENNKIRDKDDCIKRTFSEEESLNEAYKCCYMRQKIDSTVFKGKRYQCIAVTLNQYNYIKDLIKQYEAESGIDDVEIKCGSSYIKFGLLFLALFLF